MNSTAKNLVRLAGLAVGVAAAAWALRDKLLPSPEIHDEPPPRFREPTSTVNGASPDTGDASAEDLTAIKGIGPVTAERLSEAGITTIADLASADADDLAEAVGSSSSTTGKWIQAAADHG